MRTITTLLLAMLLTTSTRAADPIPLPRATPESQGVSSTALLNLINALDSQIDGMHSLVILRHGQVVAEGWWTPYNPETQHILFSLSKSFTSTAVGIAIAEGKLSLDDPILKFFPEEAPADPSNNLKAMRVSDLLRMSTGHQTEPPLGRQANPADDGKTWVARFLAHPVPFKPGTHFLYNTAATYVLTAIVAKATGENTIDYLTPRLFEPLGIPSPYWFTSPEGISLGGYGLQVRTEDIARFGQLYLNKGSWNGRQLLPASWVEAATARQTSNGSAPTSDWDQGYGYQFWRCRNGAYRGDGAFGQYCIVLPEHDTVIAITSGIRDMQAPLNLLWDLLLPALQAEPLPDNPIAADQLHYRLASLTLRHPEGKPSSPISDQINKRIYEFPDNPRGLQSLSLDLSSNPPALHTRTADGDRTTPLAFNAWTTPARDAFANGLDRGLSVPQNPLVSASAAWTVDDTLTIKLALTETPFTSTLTLHFEGDSLTLDSEHNVSFGPTKLPTLTGKVAPPN